ncbi:MAG: hypothetical protein JNL60_07820 [Bacteroidia bacterium]|nr:hypothetical protein [Bacteroidia bacterium]
MILRSSKIILLLCFYLNAFGAKLCAQDYEAKSILYNTLIGGFSGAIGSIINKPKKTKASKAFIKGFITGCGGGALMYSGKKLNMVIAQQQNISYAWLCRAVFSAGNSIVENASAYRPWYSQYHYDIGFIRFEFKTDGTQPLCRPMLMPLAFGSFVFTAFHGNFDARSSFYSGALVFTNVKIAYASYLVGSTTGNNILLTDTLNGNNEYPAVFAHEMVHTFQFQELSGVNCYFKPWTAKQSDRSRTFKTLNTWIYGDVNYGLMLVNYFVIQGGIIKNRYCRNFLENEAEVLTTGRISCP